MRPSILTVLCLFFLALNLPWLMVSGFQYDRDSKDNCEVLAQEGKCIADETTFYECARSCIQHYEPEKLMIQGHPEEADYFYELQATLSTGKKVDFERFEGYLTIVMVVPLLPGMAQYTYEMLEHVHSIFPFTVEIVILPVRTTNDETTMIQVKPKSKLLILEEWKEEDGLGFHPVTGYLEGTIPEGHPFTAHYTDRPSFYIISVNAQHTEKRVSASMFKIENLVTYYLKQLASDYTGQL